MFDVGLDDELQEHGEEKKRVRRIMDTDPDNVGCWGLFWSWVVGVMVSFAWHPIILPGAC